MNKIMMILVGSLMILSGCNQEQAKQESATVAKKEAVAAAAPAANSASTLSLATQTIDWAKAKQMADAGAIFVDVRSPGEYNLGYVPYAVNIPLQEVPRRLAELPKDKDLLIYCKSGRRSASATNYLLQNGYEKVFNVAGGFLAYPRN